MKRLEQSFFQIPAPELAPLLLGKIICRRWGGGVLRARISETEAYYGESDTACHASRGRTQRTDIMYAAGGHAYVYLCYGVHEMFNIVSGSEGFPEAVLIRGVEGYEGPGKLTRHLKINRKFNKVNLGISRELWLEDDDAATPSHTACKRVGIGYADEKDRERLWRFVVSKR